ncbi:hypothetical protein QFZ30_003583 [Arthrobacter pascens]|uniref:hypothetical protein n=1 Tax=Arthrobacter pascens TaxID=1677 RepID=UPI00278E70DD|nr:hypothetical protein [Arthrobacter pascens]MDQ0680201.1 hypothetical protein [Arthrobacter pascens]
MTFNANYLGKTVDEMLLDAGQAQATELRAALLSLGTLACLPVPTPNAQLAALMAGTHELGRQRWLRKHRAAVVGLAVVAGMGFGVTGVAASASGQGRQTSMSVQHMLEGWAPSWTIAGGPSASTAGLLPAPQPTAQHEPAPAVQSMPALPEQPLTGAVQDQAAAEAGVTAKKDDGGAAAKDPDSAAGTAAESRKATESQTEEDAVKTQKNGAVELGRVQNQLRRTLAESAERTLKGAMTVPATAAKTRAGKADPGASWLKKFSR